MTDLVQMSVEQMRAKGIENHNKMKEQNERRQNYLKEQSHTDDFRRLYRDKGKKNTDRVNSVISYQGAEDDIRKVLEIANIHNAKEYVQKLERIFNNKLTAHELRELAKVLEMAVTDTIRFVEKESNKKDLGVHNFSYKY